MTKYHPIATYGRILNMDTTAARKSVVVFDLDGTLADNTHRQHYMEQDKKDWKSFFDAMDRDMVVHEIAWIMNMMRVVNLFNPGGEPVYSIICTGRPDQWAYMTRVWLAKNKMDFDGLMMRGPGDGRPDAIVKKEMLDLMKSMGYDPILSIDDRPEVVQMWRDNGVPCLQCDPAAWYKRSGPLEAPVTLDDAVRIISRKDNEIRQLRDELERLQEERAL